LEKEGTTGAMRKKEREGAAPERVAEEKREEKSEKEGARERVVATSESVRGGQRTEGERGRVEKRFLLRPASKMALAAAPLVIKINN